MTEEPVRVGKTWLNEKDIPQSSGGCSGVTVDGQRNQRRHLLKAAENQL